MSCLLLTTVLLAGCWQKSVSPFYATKDLIAELKLAGTWTEEKEPDGNRTTWSFVNADTNRFDVAVQNKNERYEFDGRVFKLDNDTFLDFEGKAHGVSIIPAHHLFRLVELGAEMKLAALNPDWMQKWLHRHPDSLAHFTNPERRNERDKDELVLTADTKALQKFVREHMNDEDFFTDPVVLKNESSAVTANEKK
jgi:hypothetical protein